MKNNQLFTSHSQDWNTPQALYDELNREFYFDFDPCPNNPQFDGLAVDWGQRNFCNPPYKHLKQWCAKAFQEFKKGKLVVLLIPARTDTAAWHDFCMQATQIRFIRGRVHFVNPVTRKSGRATFPSAIVIFDPTERLTP